MGRPVATVSRVRLDDVREAVTRKFTVPDGDGGKTKIHVTVGFYADGRPGEVFLHADKTGSLARGAFDAVAIAISIGLQHGVPLDEYVKKLVAMRFEPSGFTGDKHYPTCTSVLDLVGRWMRDKLSSRTQGEL